MRFAHSLVTALCFVPGVFPADSVSVSPASFQFESTSSGIVPRYTVPIKITSAAPWTAKFGNGPEHMLALSKKEGTGTDTVEVQLTLWWAQGQKAGTYEQTVIVSPKGTAGGSATARISLRVVPAVPEPVFTYPSGPHGCTNVPGLADGAICTVPQERPPGNFEPPPPGRSYIDPNFGARVTVLTAPLSLHGYSSPSAVSAGSRYALVTGPAGQRLVDVKSGEVRMDKVPLPAEGSIWDAADDSVLYVIGKSDPPVSIVRHDMRTQEAKILADFSKPPYNFTKITTGGTGEGSRDNWMAFYAPAEQTLCAFSAANSRAYCAGLKTVPGGPYNVDFSTMSKGIDSVSGKRYVVAVAGPQMLVFTVNEMAGRLELDSRGPERIGFGKGNGDGICDPGEACVTGGHSDLFADSHGNQLMLVAQEFQGPCEFALVSYRLNARDKMGLPVELGGGMRRIMRLFRCGQDRWVDQHIGCAKLSPYCVVSTTYGNFGNARNPDDLSPSPRGAYVSEIFVVRDNGVEIRRLAQHRSVQFTNEDDRGYWSTPRACISPDGRYVIADSNFGFPKAQRVIQIETGFGR